MERREFLAAGLLGPLAKPGDTAAAASSDVLTISPGDSVADALAAIPSGGELQFIGGTHEIEAGLTTPPDTMFTRVGRRVTIVVHGTGPGFIAGDDFILNPGFTFLADDPTANTNAIRFAGKRSVAFAPKCIGFGNKVFTALPTDPAQLNAWLDIAPYPLIYRSFEPGTWADWHHLIAAHVEFCYGVALSLSPSNVEISQCNGRGSIGLGGGLHSHMRGNPSGAPLRVRGFWLAHAKAPGIWLTKDPDITRPGGSSISDYIFEPGAGQPGIAARVESDGNKFGSHLTFIGGDTGFSWGDGVRDNVVDGYVTRNKQGGVGPAIDTGPVADQIYTFAA